MYLEIALRLKAKQDKNDDKAPELQQLDFEFVLFASAVIDYDYIMSLLAKYPDQQGPAEQEKYLAQIISYLQSDAKFIDEREEIIAYAKSLKASAGLSAHQACRGYEIFKAEKAAEQLAAIAAKHGIAATALQDFVDDILRRMVFDGDQLSSLLASLGLSWRARVQKELDIMLDLAPLLRKRAQGREISGLSAYE